MTSSIEPLIQRNAAYAADNHQTHPIQPATNVVVLSCLDARADPAHLLGLAAGEALVIRNAGGRVTTDVEQLLAVLAVTFREAGPIELFLIHHTDCGLERLAAPEARAKMSKATGIDESVLTELAIGEHETSLREDLDRLAASPLVPPGIRVTGALFDHDSGRIETRFDEVLS